MTPELKGNLEAGKKLASNISIAEWLGPLAPIALSPFFGLACLSGLATYGPEWLQKSNGLLNPHSPLSNPILFWSMAGLAILSSLPRFTKVSKPIALAAENLEAYSSVIILLMMRFLAASGSESGVAEVPQIAIAGIGTMSFDVVMGVAAGLNIIVINAIKLFIELMVWLIPFPFVDGILEVANKGIAAGMMSLYCYSPALATTVNLMLLGLCSLVFLSVIRRVRYYREMIVGPILGKLFPGWFAMPTAVGVSVKKWRGFLAAPWYGLPILTPVTVVESDAGTKVIARTLFKRVEKNFEHIYPEHQQGVISLRATLSHPVHEEVAISYRRSL